MKALGLIELLGYVPAVVALDTALKTAEVSFQQISKIDKGIVSLTVTGDVSAVQAAMDAAAAAAEQVGQVLYVHVIPRPHDEVDEMLNPPPAAPLRMVPAMNRILKQRQNCRRQRLHRKYLQRNR